MTIKDYIAKLKKADKDYINEQVLRIVQNESAYAIDLNQSQLLSGVDSNGESLMEYQNPAYAEYKERLNPAPGLGIPDLKLTGRFYEGWYLQFGSKGWPITFYSRDSKAKSLQDKYGKAIFGLTQDNIENFRQHIKPKIKALFASIFGV